MKGRRAVLGGSLAMAGVSTLGDFVWATWLPEHRAVYGVTHGTLLFMFIGMTLGVAAGRIAAGALGGAVVGAAAAGTFYVAAPFLGYSAMFVVWVGAWLALAALYGRLRSAGVVLGAVAGRGMIAAIASGLAFYGISDIWQPFDPRGWDYALHLVAWTAAYLPGFAALLLSRQAVGR